MNKTKSQCYTSLKVVCALLVVLGHVTRMYVGDGVVTPASGSQLIKALSLYIYSFHMPLFFIISGCVYGYCLEQGKYREDWKFAKNKAKRLLIPYLVFGLLWVTPFMVLLGFTDEGFLRYGLTGILLSRNSRHLWYVLALFWDFLSAIPARRLLERLHPAVFMAISLVILFISQKFQFSLLQLQAALYYQFFFYLGYYVNKYFDKLAVFTRRHIYKAALCPVVLIVKFWVDLNLWTTLAYSLIGAYMLFSAVCILDLPKLRASRLFKLIDRDSFALYLFHPMIVYLIFYFLGAYAIPPLLLTAGAFTAACAVSFALAYLVRKARLGLIIGE